MKVVRPKFCITDSSSFKSHVQELTGNGTAFPCSDPPSLPREVVALYWEDHGEQERSIEVSFYASVESIELCNNQVRSAEEPNQFYNQVYFNGQQSDSLTISRQADKLACQDIESWLLASYGAVSYLWQLYSDPSGRGQHLRL